MSTLQENLIARLQDVGPEMTEAAQEDVLTYLALSTPDVALKEAELLIAALNHDVLTQHIQDNTLPSRLNEGLGELLHVLMPQLGLRPVGHLAKLSNETLRTFGAQQRTFEAIAAHVESATSERQRDVLTAYLSTSPAPLFVRLMRAKFEAIWGHVMEDVQGERHMQAFRAHKGLAQQLRQPNADATALGQQMVDVTEDIKRQGQHERVVLALQSTNLDDRLVGAACVAFWRRIEHTSRLLEGVIAAAPDALPLAVLAARMDPAMARQVFSLFLMDLSLGNPEEPEYQMTDARTRALVATRWLLPRIGSPIKDEQIEVMRQSSHEVVQEALAHVESLWEAWADVERVYM